MSSAFLFRSALVPLCAAIALSGCGTEKATEPPPPVPTVDSVPPRVVWFIGPSGSVSPGDLVEFRFLAHDSVGVKRATLYFNGAFEYADSAEFTNSWKDVEVTWPVQVPNEAVIDGSATAVVIVADEAGNTASAVTSISIRDIRRPQARLDLGGLRGDETIRAGETLLLYVNAEDNHRLKYIGYYGAGLRDSVPATSVGDSHVFQLTVPTGWREQRPEFTAWARDVSGYESERTAISVRTIPVFEWTNRPLQMVALTNEVSPLRFLFDARRGVAYVVRYNPDAPGVRIDIVNVSTGAWGMPIPLPENPTGFNFSASGDSLIMSLPEARALGIVDLRQAERSVTTVPLQEGVGPVWAPLDVQVSGRHVFVALVTSGSIAGRLLDVDLSTGTQVIRTDIDGAANIPRDPMLLRLPDGRMFINPGLSGYYITERFVYSPESDTFTRTFRLQAAEPNQFSPSPSGRFMLADVVYDAALNPVDTVATQDWRGGGAALSPDGSAVYLATSYGYEKIRVSDGVILEQVKLGTTPGLMMVSPDGSRLIVVASQPANNDGKLATIFVDLR